MTALALLYPLLNRRDTVLFVPHFLSLLRRRLVRAQRRLSHLRSFGLFIGREVKGAYEDGDGARCLRWPLLWLFAHASGFT